MLIEMLVVMGAIGLLLLILGFISSKGKPALMISASLVFIVLGIIILGQGIEANIGQNKSIEEFHDVFEVLPPTVVAVGGGAPAITWLTQGSVLFANASGGIWEDNDQFYWDDANEQLGMGITTPHSNIHINATQDTTANITLNNTIGAGQFSYTMGLTAAGDLVFTATDDQFINWQTRVNGDTSVNRGDLTVGGQDIFGGSAIAHLELHPSAGAVASGWVTLDGGRHYLNLIEGAFVRVFAMNHSTSPGAVNISSAYNNSVSGNISMYVNGSEVFHIEGATGNIGLNTINPQYDVDINSTARIGNTTSYWNWSGNGVGTDGWQTYEGNARPQTFEQYITDHDMSDLGVGLTQVNFVDIDTGWVIGVAVETPLYMKWMVPSDYDPASPIDFYLEYALSANAVPPGGGTVWWTYVWSQTYECDDMSLPPNTATATVPDGIVPVIPWHHEMFNPLFQIAANTVTPGEMIHIKINRAAGQPDDYQDTVYVMALRPYKYEIAQGLEIPL